MRFRLLLVGVLTVFLASPVFRLGVSADDAADGEEDPVEDEPAAGGEGAGKTVTQADKDKDLDAEEEVKQILPSPDVEVTFLFTMPSNSKELVAGKLTKYLIGFFNKGEKDFYVRDIETSFRYHMDFSYNLQNFSAARVDMTVPPKQEATFDYGFFPHEQYSGRPLGLYVNLRYEDVDGNFFQNAAFNETITIAEDDTGFNTETLFLYVVFGCLVLLLLLGGQQFLSKMRRKHGMTKKQYSSAPVETGTSNKHEVDFEWIPKQVLEMSQKSPKAGSPRSRKIRRAGED